MTDDGPDSLPLRLLRRIDERTDRTASDMTDLKHRMTAIELQFGQMITAVGRVNERLDRLEIRLDRIERRLGLIEEPQA